MNKHAIHNHSVLAQVDSAIIAIWMDGRHVCCNWWVEFSSPCSLVDNFFILLHSVWIPCLLLPNVKVPFLYSSDIACMLSVYGIAHMHTLTHISKDSY